MTADFDGQVASSTCTGKVPESGTIFSVLGHMHTLGKTFRLTLNKGTPQQKILLDIPVWNFDWQLNYELVTPLHVNAGDPVTMTCTWDRAKDPNRPPEVHRVRRGHRGRDVLRHLRAHPRRPVRADLIRAGRAAGRFHRSRGTTLASPRWEDR